MMGTAVKDTLNLAYVFSSSNSAMGYSLFFDLVVEKCMKYI